MSAWNDFTKKIYQEGRKKDSSYSFTQALKDASKRKGEMGQPNLAMGVKPSKSKKAKTSKKSRKNRKNKKSKTQKRK